jgi:uncharacterized protein (TIGR03435 family)
MRKNSLRIISGALLLAAGLAFGQAPAAAPSFEVASVKPAGPLDPAAIVSGKMRLGMKVEGARVDIGSLSLADLIRIAYRVKPYQVSGPDWMSGERFDVRAKLPEGASQEQVPEMLQALLAERFKLTIHRQTKEQNVYALVVGKGGPKLKEAVPEVEAPPAPDPPPGTMVLGEGKDQVRMSGNMGGKGMTVSSAKTGPVKLSMGQGGNMRMEYSKLPMAMLVEMLTRFLDRPVLDMTELKGDYQVGLEVTMEDMRGMARTAGVMLPPGGGAPVTDTASDPSGGSIFTSVQQMGLKLEARKAPMDLMVVDHVEKVPTEN